MHKKLKEFIFLLPASLFIAGATFGFRTSVPVFSEILFPTEETTESKSVPERSEREKIKLATPKKEKVAGVKLSSTSGWTDGTYTGSGKGYGGQIQVEVTILKGKIKSIRILSHSGETPEYFARAKKIIPSILKEQTADVDCISKATLSSNGIRQAVAQALNKAAGKATASIADEDNPSSQTADTTSQSASNKGLSGSPADGSFEGKAVCQNFGYTVRLKANFQKGKAKSISGLKISNNSDPDNETYMKKAWRPTVAEILKKQAKNGKLKNKIDVTSGATYSSNAIVAAYQDALTKAIAKAQGTKATEETTSETPSQDRADTSMEEDSASLTSGQAKDGTYEVSAPCDPDERKAFASYTISCKVTFSGGKLTDMYDFTSTDDSNKAYYDKAIYGNKNQEGILAQLLNKQSPSGLQAIAGATCSSKTIRNLYIAAWNQAAGENLAPEEDMAEATKAPSATAGPETEASPAPVDTTLIMDGTYTVSTTVYPDEWEDFESYTLSADFTFSQGKLTNIENLTLTDDSNYIYCSQALDYMLPQFLEKQTSQVDTCSGSTCSSVALSQLYSLALTESMKDGEE
ncbi:MAG: FMN-binding protein [Eubacterium sp.]|nr:FMN-binding protein [Eubacterium sp.]